MMSTKWLGFCAILDSGDIRRRVRLIKNASEACTNSNEMFTLNYLCLTVRKLFILGTVRRTKCQQHPVRLHWKKFTKRIQLTALVEFTDLVIRWTTVVASLYCVHSPCTRSYGKDLLNKLQLVATSRWVIVRGKGSWQNKLRSKRLNTKPFHAYCQFRIDMNL